MVCQQAYVVKWQRLRAEMTLLLVEAGMVLEHIGIWVCVAIRAMLIVISGCLFLWCIYWLSFEQFEPASMKERPPLHPFYLAVIAMILFDVSDSMRLKLIKYRAFDGFQVWSKALHREWDRLSHISQIIDTVYVLELYGSHDMAKAIIWADPRFSPNLEPTDKSKVDIPEWNKQAFEICFKNNAMHAYAHTLHPCSRFAHAYADTLYPSSIFAHAYAQTLYASSRFAALSKRFLLVSLGICSMLVAEFAAMWIGVIIVETWGGSTIVAFLVGLSVSLSLMFSTCYWIMSRNYKDTMLWRSLHENPKGE